MEGPSDRFILMLQIRLLERLKTAKSTADEPKVADEILLNSESLLDSEVKSSVKLSQKLIYLLGSTIARPKYFLAFIFARFYILRRLYRLARRFKPNAIVESDRQATLFEKLDTAKAAATLNRDGMCLGLDLPQNFLLELQQHLASRDCYAGGRADLGFKIAEKKQLERHFDQPFYVARYYNLSTTCPQIIQLANDPKLQTIARSYIGRQAIYTGSSLFWTFPIEGESIDSEQQMFRYFHYDIDDFAGVRFCFYLTDVGQDDGPHTCVRGSHVKKRLGYIWNFLSRIQTKAELAKTYGRESFLTIADRAGSGFAEDTFCFHNGNPPKVKPRLFLQLHFATQSYHQSKYLDDRDSTTLHSWHETLRR